MINHTKLDHNGCAVNVACTNTYANSAKPCLLFARDVKGLKALASFPSPVSVMSHPPPHQLRLCLLLGIATIGTEVTTLQEAALERIVTRL